MFNFQNDGSDVTGSVEKKERQAGGPPALKVSTKAPDAPKLDAGNSSITVEPGKVLSSGERAILESLQDRRKELDARSRELEMRESLLKAAEKRVEAKVAELKAMEARLKASMGERDKAEAERFKGIVTMYENMKPKEAARIFDRLDMKVLVDVANADEPAQHVADPGADDAGSGRTADRRARQAVERQQDPRRPAQDRGQAGRHLSLASALFHG